MAEPVILGESTEFALQVPQVRRLPPIVATVCKNMENRFFETSNALLATAEKMETSAAQLRKLAADLHSQIPLWTT